jgi:hypothetical protein
MPLNIAPGDRKLLLWTGAILVPLVIALAILSSADQEDSGVPSTYSSQSQGAKAAYLLLQELGYKVQRWELPPAELPINPSGTILVLANPGLANPSDRNQRLALETFLARGGRILFTGCMPELLLQQASVEMESAPSPLWKSYKPELLTGLSHEGDIRLSPNCYWQHSVPPYLAHYADKGRPIVVSYPVGKGQVIWWASSIPLSNAGIREAGNMGLFLGSLGDRDNTQILWDEYYHGERASLRSYMADPPILFGLLQCVFLFAAVVFTYSRRNLPIHPAPEATRLSPLEFVETVGNLYRKAKATHAALEVPYQRFRFAATRRLGLRPETSNSDLVRALRERTGYKDPSLEGLLGRIETELYAQPSEKTVLELVQELNRHMRNLKLLPEETIIHGNRVPGTEPRTN